MTEFTELMKQIFDTMPSPFKVCGYCNDFIGYCRCHPPAETIVYNKSGEAIVWTGPIGCMRPEEV